MAGTGESFTRTNISVGNGIYKSLDAEKTWKLMGLEKTGRIANLVIDPYNPDVVLACALGHLYGSQPERGIFRSTDGGKSWEKALFMDENTGGSDPVMDPNNANILFCSHVADGNSHLREQEWWAWKPTVQIQGWRCNLEACRRSRFAEAASGQNRCPGGGEGLGSRFTR
jgi:hypothetical protein